MDSLRSSKARYASELLPIEVVYAHAIFYNIQYSVGLATRALYLEKRWGGHRTFFITYNTLLDSLRERCIWKRGGGHRTFFITYNTLLDSLRSSNARYASALLGKEVGGTGHFL